MTLARLTLVICVLSFLVILGIQAIPQVSDNQPLGTQSGKHVTTSLEQDQLTSGNPQRFEEIVLPSLKRYISLKLLVIADQDLPNGQRGKNRDLIDRYFAAQKKFEESVEENWPYYGPEFEKQQEAYSETMDEIITISKQALGREIDRDKASRQMSILEAKYPNTPLSDKTEHLIGNLYWRIKPRSPDIYLAHLKKAANSDAPLSAYRIFALTNVASAPDDDTERMNARQQFSARMNELRDPDVLAVRLAPPLPYESKYAYLKRLSGTITNIEAHYATNAVNMTVDALRTDSPQENMAMLQEKEADNPHFQAEVKERVSN